MRIAEPAVVPRTGSRHQHKHRNSMKTKTSILSVCGLASALLTLGSPTAPAQEEYQQAEPQARMGQQDQQEWREQQRSTQRQQWQQQPQQEQAWRQQQRPQQQKLQQQQQQQQYTRLIAAIQGLPGNEDVKGTVLFDRESQGARVVAEIGGLRADQQYSIRIHQFGDLGTMDAERVGESFEPGMDAQRQTVGIEQARGQANGMQQRQQAQQQQYQQPQQRQQAQQPLGNLGTVRADNDGNIRVERAVQGLQLTSGENGILGRSVVIHRSDDASRQNPVAAGVIGISQDGLPGAQARQAGQTQKTRTVGQADRDEAYDD